MERIDTPDIHTIQELTEFLNVAPERTIKAVCLRVAGEPVFVYIPGERELNMAKLVAYLQVPEHEIEFLDDETIQQVTGANPGFIGPVGLPEGTRILVDRQITRRPNMIAGGNVTGTHIKNVNFGRDFEGEVAEDLLMVKEGDLCPVCGEPLHFARGIEVGNIFQLGTKYSAAMNATFLDENGVATPFVMGSYGIGITRTVSAIVEQNHDDKGIIWPIVAAPFAAIITIANMKAEEQVMLAEEMEAALEAKGMEVLLDDRNERPGVKFNDRDLIGIPLRITVGKKAGENIVEFSTRREMKNEEMSPAEALERVERAVKEAAQ